MYFCFMQATYTKISNIESEVQAEISSVDFGVYLDKAAASLSKGFDIQGFRKGHAPRNIVEQKVGSGQLYDEAAEIAVRETSQKALEQVGEDTPKRAASEIRVIKLAPDNPFIYKIIFTTAFFELTDEYQAVARKVKEEEKKDVVVEEKEIDDTLKWLAKSKRKGDKGDKGDKGEALVDDEFAKSLGNFQNLSELKTSIREGLAREKEKKEKDRLRLFIIKEIIAKSKSEVPQGVIIQEIDRIEEEFRQSIAQMGLDFEEYLKKIQKEKEELRKGWRNQARERVDIASALAAIAEKEGIVPSDEEVKQESGKALEYYTDKKNAGRDIDPARLKAYIYDILQREKTFEFLEQL